MHLLILDLAITNFRDIKSKMISLQANNIEPSEIIQNCADWPDSILVATAYNTFCSSRISVKCTVVAVKSRPDFISVMLYLSGPPGSMTPIHLVLRIEYRSSRCYGAWEMLHISWTDSINLGLQFSFFIIGLVALEGSTFY